MKKVLFSLAVVGLLATSLISCQSNQKETAEAGTDTTKVTVSTDTTAAKAAASSTIKSENLNVSPTVQVKAPEFSSEDVNLGFAKFEPLKQEYIDAINSKDAKKIKEVTAKYNAWVVDAASWGDKLPKDENQIFINHYTKLVVQWDKLTSKLKK